MNPAAAGLLGGAVVAAYLPSLRRQIRAGSVTVGHLGVRPLRIERDAHPIAFRMAAVAIPVIAGLLLAACALLIVEAMRP